MSLLGAGEIRELAAKLDLKPSKSLGQNFVHDANVCRKIVRTAGVTSSDIALEIGPGLGSLTLAMLEEAQSVIAVEIAGGFDACQSLVSQLQVVRIATSFGGPETLVCHPATSTHVGLSPEALATMGVTDGLLRFSIGLEDADDLVDELHRAIATL